MNRELSSNFCRLKSANNVKFTEKFVMNAEKHDLVKKNVYKWTERVFATTNLSRKDSQWKENSEYCFLLPFLWQCSSYLLDIFIYICLCIYIYIYIPAHWPSVRVFANGPGDLCSIPRRVIPKTFKMVLDTFLLNTQQ